MILRSSLNVLLLLISFSVISQEPPTIMPGIGPTYSFGLNSPGINMRAYVAADHHFCFGPEVSLFKKTIHNGEEVGLFEANINLHYLLELSSHTALYPLTGINYTIESKRDLIHTDSFHQTMKWGANIGGGIHQVYNRFLFFGEYKYVISELDDHFLTIGALYNFPLRKKGKNDSMKNHH